jgi:branched-chain amino acid transport system permease protein
MDLQTVYSIILLGLTIGAIYALIAIGLNLIWGTMRLLNIGHGDIIMLGGYAAFWLFTLMGISPLIAALAAIASCAILGFIVYKGLYASSLKKVRALESLEGNSLLIFFGILIIIENVAVLLWHPDYRGYTYLSEGIPILGVPISLNRLIASIVAIAVCLGFYVFLRTTLFGKAIRALIQNKDASQIVGINTNNIYIFCFCSAFGMAGLAGALISMFYTISPFMGLSYSMLAFVVVILGGLGNILGSLLAGLLIGVVTTAGVAMTTPGFQFIIQYLLFIIVIIFLPQGLFGVKSK